MKEYATNALIDLRPCVECCNLPLKDQAFAADCDPRNSTCG